MPEEQNFGQAEPMKPRKERPSKAVKAMQEQTFHSYSSYWPIALAFALLIALIGVITHPIVLGIGIVLASAAVIGWGLERR
ncbi:MAG: aa3-type cytochrome oxidase subunit IV [Ktedonobacteraceae bacterium]